MGGCNYGLAGYLPTTPVAGICSRALTRFGDLTRHLRLHSVVDRDCQREVRFDCTLPRPDHEGFTLQRSEFYLDEGLFLILHFVEKCSILIVVDDKHLIHITS